MAKTLVKKVAKSWTQKFEEAMPTTVHTMEREFLGFGHGDKMLVPGPDTVLSYIRSIPRGTVKSIPMMRVELAKQFNADVTCPMMANRLAWWISEIGYEQILAGRADVVPFWRIFDPKSRLRGKVSFDLKEVDRLLANESTCLETPSEQSSKDAQSNHA